MGFMRTMLEEKGLMGKLLEFAVEGITHFMTVEIVVDFIENSPLHIQETVNKSLSSIDFSNGNVLDFVEYLAKGIVQL